MPKKRFSAEQIVTLLRQIEVLMAQGKSAPEACRDAELGALCIEGPLCGADEQAKHQSGYCGDQADTKPHHIFGMPVQMMFRQCTAKQRSEPDSAQR